jgi:hypothetical protein
VSAREAALKIGKRLFFSTHIELSSAKGYVPMDTLFSAARPSNQRSNGSLRLFAVRVHYGSAGVGCGLNRRLAKWEAWPALQYGSIA